MEAARLGAVRCTAMAWVLVAIGLLGCGTKVVVDERRPAGDGGSGGDALPGVSDQVDLLLMIDNSRGMVDEQATLAATVPHLVDLFAEHDLHIGIVTSSLGGLGSDSCDGTFTPSENDHGRLVARAGIDEPRVEVPTYQGLGFLAWDPHATHDPPGETSRTALDSNLTAMIDGVGAVGCAFESSLESWYRFLVEPEPYADIALEDNKAVPVGVDETLLAQRQAFLRPGSVLIVLMLSDENDCSTRVGGQFYFARQLYNPGTNDPYHLPKPRKACATDPANSCCRSCGQGPGDGCDDSLDDCDGPLSFEEDPVHLRCWDQKRRFGIDFNHPLDRYVNGLVSTTVTDHAGNIVPNPLFFGGRSPEMVYLVGLVGVPWQYLARSGPDGTPDASLGFMGPDELVASGRWPAIVGDPAAHVAPTDPLMIESQVPRTGVSPITGDAVAPPGSGYLANPINGHEIQPHSDRLQYTCIFPLPAPRDCTTTSTWCECPSDDDPLCEDPTGVDTTQYFGRAHPGLRQLAVLRDIGPQGVVGSVCPARTDDPGAPEGNYRPVLGTIAETVSKSLAP
jgi:hypothetical protein